MADKNPKNPMEAAEASQAPMAQAFHRKVEAWPVGCDRLHCTEKATNATNKCKQMQETIQRKALQQYMAPRGNFNPCGMQDPLAAESKAMQQ